MDSDDPRANTAPTEEWSSSAARTRDFTRDRFVTDQIQEADAVGKMVAGNS
jgi:hypothetical protein